MICEAPSNDKDVGLRYEGGVYDTIRQDSDCWSNFKACDLIKGMDSSFKIEDVKMWWKDEHGCLENDLKLFVNDEDATMLALCVDKTKCDVEIYTEARLSSGDKTYMERLLEKEKDHDCVEENEDDKDNESFEDYLNGIHFEDSEEERMHDFDDDIGEGLNNRVENDVGTGHVHNGVGTTPTTAQNEAPATAQNKETHAPPEVTPAQHEETLAHTEVTPEQPGENPAQPEVNLTQSSVSFVEAMKMYCGIDPDELEALLNDDYILDVESLCVGTSPAKSNRHGPKIYVGPIPKVPKPVVKTFIGQRPKVSKTTVKSVPTEANKPSISDLVKIMISPSKKSKIVASLKIKSDRLRTLKTEDIMGPGKDPKDPFVIPEENSSVGSARGRRIEMISRRA
ncbi:unnamed protein product [Vicia faba]|uniref:PB1-like domain-containing protein n=1 Tax=Vicia faba TaxID=3906 RepID=A0AAV1A5L4_VICFA|nr:unnamed protein product [Vicia faba]